MERANWLAEANYRLSRLQLILSALGAGGLLVSLYLTRQATQVAIRGEDAAFAAVQQAQEANWIAQAANEVSQRPWLSIAEPEITSIWVLPGDHQGQQAIWIEYQLSITNSGSTPALFVGVGAHFGAWFSAEMHERIEQLNLWMTKTQEGGRYIAPNATETMPMNYRFETTIPSDGPNTIAVAAYIAVSYGAPNGGRRRTTANHFVVAQRQAIRTPAIMNLHIDELIEQTNYALDLSRIEVRRQGGTMT